MWLAFSQDTKQNLTLINDDQDPLTMTLNVLKKKLQLHVVEIIGERTLIYSCCDSAVPFIWKLISNHHTSTLLMFMGCSLVIQWSLYDVDKSVGMCIEVDLVLPNMFMY